MLQSKLSDLQTHLSKIQAGVLLDKRLLITATYLLFVTVQGIVTLRSGMGFNLNTFILYGLAYYFYYQKRDNLKFANNLPAQIMGAILIFLPSFKLLTLCQVDSNGF